MKKYILFPVLFIGLTVVSCQKEKIVPAKNKVESNKNTYRGSRFIVDPNDRNELVTDENPGGKN